MLKTKAVKPPESTAESDPVSRLINTLLAEGFTPLHGDEEAFDESERVFHRTDRVSFVEGETVFVLIDFPVLTEKVLNQAIEGQSNLFKAKRKADKALSVFQPTTVYVCIIARNESPHTASLNRYIQNSGGAIVIPVILVPEINQVVYPTADEKSMGPIPSRIHFLQYVLGERRDPVNLHRNTLRTFYASLAFVGILLIVALGTWLISLL
jgi:hypothetical protein